MPNSLFGRMLLISIIVLTGFFGLIYYAVTQVFITNMVNAIGAQLKLQSYLLVSSAVVNDAGLVEMPEELREARFEDFESGLYGLVADASGNILWRSYSSHSIDIEKSTLLSTNLNKGSTEFSQDERYFIYHYTVRWELQDDQPQPIIFTVLEDKKPSLKKISTFKKSIRRWLVGSGIGLITALLLTLRWGTHPLRRLAAELKDIENGATDQIMQHYPPELSTVTRNLNELIKAEHRQRERYHTTLADLAHSLKTPLAVIHGELQRRPLPDQSDQLIAAQSQRMEEIIKHQLQRAVLAAPNTLGEAIAIDLCVEKIGQALDKVYQNKGITLKQAIDADATFRGDQRDIMEVLGNIMDNAYKACINTVKVSAQLHGNKLVVEIHDDGAGIPELQREEVMQRGRRLDSHSNGEGIGLAVVRDIVDSYEGKISIEQSPLGGALFRITF